MKLDLTALNDREQKICEELLPVLGIETGEHGIPLVTETADKGLEAYVSNSGELVIAYDHDEPACFCRALGHLKKLEESGVPVKETPAFDKLRYMADMSRNGLMNVPTAKRMMRYLALMGYNDFALYLEDGYSVPGYPYFGRQRPRYTEADIRELIAYGELFGMTVTPYVQTLAHYDAMLKWDAMREIKDKGNVLYVGNEKTYEFLDALLGEITRLFKVRVINIGMDEAHELGLGRRLEREGYTDKPTLMRLHLKRVAELCKKHGITPMIWSDMFFRPFVEKGGYYSPTVEVPQEVIDGVPEGFVVTYWDYYTIPDTEKHRAAFDNMLRQHKRFKNPIAFAGGTWKWTGFAPQNRFSLIAGEYHVTRCMEEGIRDIAVTAWGDDGAEASVFSALAAVLLYGERLYGETGDISDRFKEIFGLDLDTYLLLDIPNFVPDLENPESKASKNPSKYFFYADPICGKLDAHVLPSYAGYFAEVEKKLAAHTDEPNFGNLFATLAALCGALKDKVSLGIDARKAYEAGDMKALGEVADRCEAAVGSVDRFTDLMRVQWFSENKPVGFEALEMRFGAVRARLIGAAKTLRLYISGSIPNLDMLEEPLLPLIPGKVGPDNVMSLTSAGQSYPATVYSE